LYYVSDRSGIANIYRVPVQGGDPLQVSNVKYGASDIFVDGDKVYFNSYTNKGYNIVYCGADEVVDMQPPSGLRYYEPLLPKEPAGTLDFMATEKPDTTLLLKSKKYHQYSDPFRFLGWLPDVEGANYSASFSTANNLETLFTTVTESYNSDFKTWRTNLGVTYSGFYPELYFGASLGKVGDNFVVPTFFGKLVPYTFTWKENIYSASVSLPLNLSRLYYTQKVNVGIGLSWYDVINKPTDSYEEIPNGGLALCIAPRRIRGRVTRLTGISRAHCRLPWVRRSISRLLVPIRKPRWCRCRHRRQCRDFSGRITSHCQEISSVRISSSPLPICTCWIIRRLTCGDIRR
ncbi:MAG: hypothetical protein IJ933_02095, partial [Bacteroidales bacterium]|nr:hypothetical protein [Bacteroidales bacterium]